VEKLMEKSKKSQKPIFWYCGWWNFPLLQDHERAIELLNHARFTLKELDVIFPDTGVADPDAVNALAREKLKALKFDPADAVFSVLSRSELNIVNPWGSQSRFCYINRVMADFRSVEDEIVQHA